jgi:hypothetical protein
MKKAKRKPLQKTTHGYPVPRVYHRKAHGKKSARLLIKCGDCDQKFEIHYAQGEDLEIAEIRSQLKTGAKLLLPVLKNSHHEHAEGTELGRYPQVVTVGDFSPRLSYSRTDSNQS